MKENGFNLSMNEMAATLAHEVRNPLALAIANVNILELDCSDHNNKSRFDIIKRELTKIGDLMCELMELAIPSKEAPSAELREMLEDICAPFTATYAGDITFTISTAEEITAYIAPSRLRLILNNLIKNAAEAIKSPDGPEHGNGRIDIRLTASNDKAKITIQDNGVGMDESAAANAMSSRYTSKQTGTGIGLYAANALAEQFGGNLTIAGEPGKVCIVTLELVIS